MKKIIVSFCCVLNAVLVIGQNSEPSAKVKMAFTSNELSTKTTDEIDYLNFYAGNSYSIHQTDKSGAESVLLSNIATKNNSTINSASDFNPLMLKLEPKISESTFIKIDETGEVIQLFSKERIDILFDRHMINKKKLDQLKKNN